MSTDPTAEHIDAVARALAPTWPDDTRYAPGEAEGLATTLLAEPGLHAALAASLPAEVMLAALVDRGTLRPDAHCAAAYAAHADGDYRVYSCADVDTSCPPDRLVTPWEVAP